MTYIEDVVRSLDQESFESLKLGVIQKLREEARDMASVMGSAFISELRVMGLHKEADEVRRIHQLVLRWRAS